MLLCIVYIIKEYRLELSLPTLKSAVIDNMAENTIHTAFPEQHAIVLNEHIMIRVCALQLSRLKPYEICVVSCL